MALIITLPFLFLNFNGSSPPSPRFTRELFNLCHIPLSLAVAYLAWQAASRHIHRPQRALLVCLTLTILFGATVELLQTLTGRSASWSDIQLNLAGLALFLAIGPGSLPIKPRARRLIALAAIIAIAISLLPLVAAVTDYTHIKRHPSVLADFESAGQLSRWDRGTVIADPDKKGNRVLRVGLGTQTYEGSTLEYLPRNWRNRASLHFEIFIANADPSPGNTRLHIKIRDSHAVKNGDLFEDRYNRVWRLPPGWNAVDIPIKEIVNGPEHRPMALNSIHAISLFFVHRSSAGVMLLDNLRLE